MTRPKTLIDASWWLGGNKDRGIGQYLKHYLQKVFSVPRQDRLWLFPQTVESRSLQEFIALFGGRAVVLDGEIEQQETDIRILCEKENVKEVFFPSPFERPWSLLQFLPLFQRLESRTSAVVFDILPLEYPQEILRTWPEDDQRVYRQSVERLTELSFLWAISPATLQALQKHLAIPSKRLKVLSFGLRPDWLIVPELDHKPVRESQTVLTISGGEWRKNLEGTLQYFADNFSPKSRLVVICQLGKKQELRLLWLAFRLGVLFRVRFLGQVSEKEKWEWLYKAQTFLFLSKAEGLGIPLLEAERAGVPKIILSRELMKSGLGSLVTSPTVAKS